MSADQGSRHRPLKLRVDGARGVGKSTILAALNELTAVSSVDDVQPLHARKTIAGNIADPCAPSEVYVLVVDARQGFNSDARQQAASARTAGARHLVLAVNKIDLTGWDRSLFQATASAFGDFAAKFEVTTAVAIPTCAPSGDNVARPSPRTPWYTGATVLRHLRGLDVEAGLPSRPLRLPIDRVSRPNQDSRLYWGVITSGTLRHGDIVQVAASSATSVVDKILIDGVAREDAAAGERVAISLASHIDVGSGAVLAHPGKHPQLTEHFSAHITWLADEPLFPGREYTLTLAGQRATASVTALKYRLEADTLRREAARTLCRNEIGACAVATLAQVAVDDFSEFPHTGHFILSDRYTNLAVGAGTVDYALRRGMNVHLQPLTVSKQVRASLKKQRPCVLWFTGLSGAGKSTIANLVEGWAALHDCHTYLLDGDNVRHGLNKDLGFTAVDRVENIRRVGEVARLFVDAGLIVLCAFISPFRAERAAIRNLFQEAEFIEIHVTAPLEVCERRDPKGLYAKCRAGQLPNFTGIDSPYEAPESPDLVLDTTSVPAAELAQQVIELLKQRDIVAASAEPVPASNSS